MLMERQLRNQEELDEFIDRASRLADTISRGKPAQTYEGLADHAHSLSTS